MRYESSVCPQCGRTFRVLAAQLKAVAPRRPYCGRLCVQASQRRRVNRTCDHCGVRFEVIASRTGARFCTLACVKAGRARSLSVRFFAALSESEQGCWHMVGDRLNGYPVLRSKRHTFLGHRLSWEFHIGPIPAGVCVRHLCHNRWCVNPAHLALGSRGDNNRDTQAAGRHPHGETHGRARATDALVRELRRRADTGERIRALAEEVGLPYMTVWEIVRRNTWKHVV